MGNVGGGREDADALDGANGIIRANGDAKIVVPRARPTGSNVTKRLEERVQRGGTEREGSLCRPR